MNEIDKLIIQIGIRGDKLQEFFAKLGDEFTTHLVKHAEQSIESSAAIQRVVHSAEKAVDINSLICNTMIANGDYIKSYVERLYSFRGIEIKGYDISPIVYAHIIDLQSAYKTVVINTTRALINLAKGSSKPDYSRIMNLGKIFKRALTNTAHTAIQTLFREVVIAAGNASDVVDYKLYGIVHDKTRPFCKEYEGVILTLEKWDKLDNLNANPVSIYGGGYNSQFYLIPEKP